MEPRSRAGGGGGGGGGGGIGGSGDKGICEGSLLDRVTNSGDLEEKLIMSSMSMSMPYTTRELNVSLDSQVEVTDFRKPGGCPGTPLRCSISQG